MKPAMFQEGGVGEWEVKTHMHYFMENKLLGAYPYPDSSLKSQLCDTGGV